MRRILTTTAIVALTALPLSAQQENGNATENSMNVTIGEQEFRATNVIGAKVYMSAEGETASASETESGDVPDSWTEIGSVEDVFVDQNGEISTVVFVPNGEVTNDNDRLGLEAASVEFRKASDSDELRVVYSGDKVSLEEQEEFDQASAEEEGQRSASEEQQASNDQQMQADDEQMQQAADTEMEKDGLTIRAADLTGHTVYIPAEGSDAQSIGDEVSDPAEDWEQVGDVANVVLSREGEIRSITLDAGGFLGMGEKEVETSMEELRFVRDSDADADNEFFIVFTGDRAQLEEQNEFDRTQAEAEGNRVMPGEDNTRVGNEMPEGEARDEQTMSSANTGEQDMQGESEMQNEETADAGAQTEDETARPMTQEQMAQLTASELEGQTVYGTNGDSIGDVSTLVLDDSGEIDRVVVDVGGFLGLGEKPVALPFDELQIEQETGGVNSIEVTTDHTQEELENMEAWNDA